MLLVPFLLALFALGGYGGSDCGTKFKDKIALAKSLNPYPGLGANRLVFVAYSRPCGSELPMLEASNITVSFSMRFSVNFPHMVTNLGKFDGIRYFDPTMATRGETEEMFTPENHKNVGRENNFSGFRDGQSNELSLMMYKRRVGGLEEMVSQVLERVAKLECENEEVKREITSVKKELRKAYTMNSELVEENNTLKKQLKNEMEEVKKCKEEIKRSVIKVDEQKTAWVKQLDEVKRCKEEIKRSVNKVDEQSSVWAKQQQENEISFKKILVDQQKAKEEVKEKMVKVIKEKEKLVRDTVEKVRCAVVFGVVEEKELKKPERESQEREKMKMVLTEILEEEQPLNYVDEFHRIGKYQEGKDRPIKVKFVTQSKAEEVIKNAWRLARKEEFKKVWINKEMDREERELLKKLVEQKKQKNLERTEEEKEKFYYQVKDLEIKKREIRKQAGFGIRT